MSHLDDFKIEILTSLLSSIYKVMEEKLRKNQSEITEIVSQ